MEIILGIATILGGVTALWFFWDKLKSYIPNFFDSKEKKIKIYIMLNEQYKFTEDDTKLKSIVQDLIYNVNDKNNFEVICYIEKNNENINKVKKLSKSKDLSEQDRELRNRLQTKTKSTNEKLLNISKSIEILFIGCKQNYTSNDFGTNQGLLSILGLLNSYENFQNRTKIDIWKDNKFGLSAPIYLLQKEVEFLLETLNIKDIQELAYGPYYVYELPNDIRIQKAIPAIAKELWYQINIRKHSEDEILKEFNPSNWKYGLG